MGQWANEDRPKEGTNIGPVKWLTQTAAVPYSSCKL